MQFEPNQHEHSPNATSPHWLAPLAVLIAWLVSLLNHIANLKRIRATTRFKPHWTQCWDDLRRLEWHRDQMLAQGAVLLLAGKTLDDAEAQLTEPPSDYGGPQPRTPFQMQRRFLAIAAWLKDPEAMIRRHAERIARRAGMDLSSPLAAHGSTDAALRAAAHHELAGVSSFAEDKVALMLSRLRSGRPSKHERGLASARGPPIRALFATRYSLLPQRTQRA